MQHLVVRSWDIGPEYESYPDLNSTSGIKSVEFIPTPPKGKFKSKFECD